jgi:hypothetical protein
VGIDDYPTLIDGGLVTAPRVAFWNPEGHRDVENHGVSPDYDVDLDPQAVRAGRDPQLEKAVAVVLEALKKDPPPHPRKPAFPNYHKGAPPVGQRRGGRDTVRVSSVRIPFGKSAVPAAWRLDRRTGERPAKPV